MSSLSVLFRASLDQKAPFLSEGRIYDSTEKDIVRTQIASFVETYKIDLSELVQPDLSSYKVNNLQTMLRRRCLFAYFRRSISSSLESCGQMPDSRLGPTTPQ